ncbi:MAG: hypothetical protein Q8L98_04155 [Chlamydiales bacterium]|nr:hypothetical protein [Chlamydiales bacterium]
MRKAFYVLFCLPLWLHAHICYFLPPSGWACSLPKNMSPHVKIGFVAPETSEFRPSINLALEKVDVSLAEYLKAVKQIHLAQPNTHWRDLGKFKFMAGEGRLTEISSKPAWGEIKMLQAIFIQDKTAYILTAAVLKKDYIKQQKVLLEALQSLCLVPDLYQALPEEKQRQQFDQLFSSIESSPAEEQSEDWKEKQWSHLQAIVNDECSAMGAHWQFLALQEGYHKIYTSLKK